jgi:putative endonuclease
MRERDAPQCQSSALARHSRESGNPWTWMIVQMDRTPCVYLLASDRNGTLYAGVTSNLVARIWQHREHAVEGFTDRYDVTRLVWYEMHETMEAAIVREKQIKKWNRAWKLELIDGLNPSWRDLWPDITGQMPKAVSMDSRFRGNDGP